MGIKNNKHNLIDSFIPNIALNTKNIIKSAIKYSTNFAINSIITSDNLLFKIALLYVVVLISIPV